MLLQDHIHDVPLHGDNMLQDMKRHFTIRGAQLHCKSELADTVSKLEVSRETHVWKQFCIQEAHLTLGLLGSITLMAHV